MKYAEAIKSHLAQYRSKKLEITECGTWHKKEYPHILPEGRRKENVLKTIRGEFWEYAHRRALGEKCLKDSLHQCFHHLNSSQALCFNLFYPFLLKPEWLNFLPTVLLGRNAEVVNDAEFEHIEDTNEGTNFDFFMQLRSGRRLFFECKFTEVDFGRAKDDKKHQQKLVDIYRFKLQKKVKPGALESSVFLKHYQLLRNISHVNPENKDHLFLIFPRGNSDIVSPLVCRVGVLDDFLAEKMKSCVTVLQLEDLIKRIQGTSVMEDSVMKMHWHLFEEKYLPGSGSPSQTNP